MATPAQVREFWIDETGPKGWYAADAALDAQVRRRFEAPWRAARAGGMRGWCTRPQDALAFLILTDQFPRNMFRDQAEAFATDALALSVAKNAIYAGFDRVVPAPARQFFYLPLMHSESLQDQSHAVRLYLTRMPAGNLLHARAHREVIRRFGRFPYRNAALGRVSTAAEQEFLRAGAYGAVVQQLQAQPA